MTAVTKFLSFNWMRGVSDDKRISIIHRLILIRILIHREKDGQCNPGYDAVAKELGVHRTTVMRAVDIAVRFRWLAPPIRGRRANASFVFVSPDQEVAPAATSKPDQEVAEQSDILENQEVAPDELRSRSKRLKKSLKKSSYRTKSKTSSQHGQRAKKNGQKDIYQPPDFVLLEARKKAPGEAKGKREKKARAASADLDSDFAGFMFVYPRKDFEDAARKPYAAAIKRGATPAELKAGAERYAAHRVAEEPTDLERRAKYTKHAATWLNAGGWKNKSSPGTGPPTIDQQGKVVASPLQQPEESDAEIAARLLASCRMGKW